MRPATRPCPVLGCDQRIPYYWLMCRPHWRRVPILLKRAVWATYHEGQQDDLSLVTPEYIEARRLAVEAAGADRGGEQRGGHEDLKPFPMGYGDWP
ncbi:MAG: hypothetical protein ABSD47_01295 [Candidatus Methylomirabilota bacterium]|jgi:hypothetical protein